MMINQKYIINFLMFFFSFYVFLKHIFISNSYLFLLEFFYSVIDQMTMQLKVYNLWGLFNNLGTTLLLLGFNLIVLTGNYGFSIVSLIIEWMFNWPYSIELLPVIFILLIIFIFIIFFISSNNVALIKYLSLLFSLIILLLTIILWILYNNELGNYIYTYNLFWLEKWNIYYSLGIDGISIFFIILTALLIPICILISWKSITYKTKEYMLLLLFIEFLLFNVFSVLDLLFFYIFFESILIPMFLLIGVWGSRQRKIHAAYQFFFFTLLGSILMLLGIITIYFHTGTTDIRLLSQFEFNFYRQLFLWLSFFASFAVKIPMLPVHIWLPEAHVEAPTSGSVILAGILLKMGTYGMIRYMLPIFPQATIYFKPLVFMLCVISIIYSSLTTIRQIDLKKIIAYSSVAHMNFAVIGLFSDNIQGLEGCLYFMLGHGFVSSGLFICIGILYERYHTRNILYYGGLVQMMPIYSVIFLIFTLANIGLPGTSNFIGEFLVLIGIWHVNSNVAFLGSIGMILGAVYSIWLYNRVIFGQVRFYALTTFNDITRREFWAVFPLIFMLIITGLNATILIDTFNMSVNNYIRLL